MKRKWAVGIFLIFLLFLLGRTVGLTNNEADFGFEKEEFNWEYNYKDSDEDILLKADSICEGKIYVDSSISEPYICELEKIDWDITFTKSPGTFQLYLQALNPISYLTRAYRISNEEKYLETAEQIIKEWMIYEKSTKGKDNPYLWYDHGTAIRTNNLIYFLLSYKECEALFDEDFCKEVIVLLNEHADHLADDTEYFANHNHGIFQDQALMHVAYFLNNKNKQDWIELAKRRLAGQKEFAFSDEMVHVENSPGYQMGGNRIIL